MPRKRPVIAPLPISASLSLRPVEAKPAGGRGSCKVRCSGDHACVGRADIPHSIHTCRDVLCICRSDLRESGKGVSR